jgi:hypothetical protein
MPDGELTYCLAAFDEPENQVVAVGDHDIQRCRTGDVAQLGQQTVGIDHR